MDGTRHLCGPIRDALQARGFDVVVVEYATDGPCDYVAALQQATAALDALDGPAHVLGWSFSGPVALRLATARPDRVRSVTLVATFVTAPLRWLLPLGVVLLPPIVGALRTLRRLPIWLGRPSDDPLRRDKAAIWARVSARTLTRRIRAIRRVDARDDLRAVRQPLLYLASSNDRVVPPSNLTTIRHLRPDITVTTIEGDHFALYHHPEAGAQAITTFTTRTTP